MNKMSKTMAEQMTATVRLETEMRFEAEAGSGHHVTLDAAEHGGGHNEGFRPMELLLVGLAGCTGMDVISLLRKKREHVTGYAVMSWVFVQKITRWCLSRSTLCILSPGITSNQKRWHE